MECVQQHFWCNVMAIVIQMVKAIPEEGEASHDTLIRSTVFRKLNRKVEVNDIIVNQENCMVSNIRKSQIVMNETSYLCPRKGTGLSVGGTYGPVQPSAKLIKIFSGPTSW